MQFCLFLNWLSTVKPISRHFLQANALLTNPSYSKYSLYKSNAFKYNTIQCYSQIQIPPNAAQFNFNYSALK